MTIMIIIKMIVIIVLIIVMITIIMTLIIITIMIMMIISSSNSGCPLVQSRRRVGSLHGFARGAQNEYTL